MLQARAEAQLAPSGDTVPMSQVSVGRSAFMQLGAVEEPHMARDAAGALISLVYVDQLVDDDPGLRPCWVRSTMSRSAAYMCSPTRAFPRPFCATWSCAAGADGRLLSSDSGA